MSNPRVGGSTLITWDITAGNPILNNFLSVGDSNPAFQIDGDGSLHWGVGGASAPSIYLKGVVGTGLVTGSNINLSAFSPVDGVLSVAGQNSILLGSNGGNVYIAPGGVGGSANGRASVNTDGSVTFNNGTLSFKFGTAPPAATVGNNGDFFFNSTGGAGTTIYQKRAGAWVGIV